MIRRPPRSTPFPTRRSSDLVPMRRRARGETVERWRCDRLERFAPLVRKLARWAADHGGRLADAEPAVPAVLHDRDRKSTRLNSSHANISYAVFCLKKKTIQQ